MALYSIRYDGPNPEPDLTQALVIAPTAGRALTHVDHLIGPGEGRADYTVTEIKTTGTRLLWTSEEW